LAVYATYYISESIINTVTPAQLSEKAPDKAADLEKTISISMILLRSVVLIPIYLGFGFAFSQYRKERDLEEEYAHKSAVASSLPNYGDLAKDDNVKDQIVSGASNVIFASPINKVKQTETKSDVIESMKGLFETAGNAFKKE